MARIRSVHPKLFTDEAFAGLSMAARVLLIGLGTFADYADFFIWSETAIAKHVGLRSVGRELGELCDAGLVRKVPDGGEILFAFGHSRKLISKWELLRSIVFRRDKFTCQYCGSLNEPLHCDHVVPVSRGGSSEIDNLRTACKPCNLSKNDRLLSEWRQ